MRSTEDIDDLSYRQISYAANNIALDANSRREPVHRESRCNVRYKRGRSTSEQSFDEVDKLDQ
jgi:hypothetical protein